MDPTAAAGTREQIVIKPRTRRSDTTKNLLANHKRPGMQFDPDPTRDIALNEKREANIGGKWVQCTPTGRRPAIKAVIDGEEPMPSRGYPGEPIRRKRAAASWSTYRRTRSGVMTAWNQAVNEANPRPPDWQSAPGTSPVSAADPSARPSPCRPSATGTPASQYPRQRSFCYPAFWTLRFAREDLASSPLGTMMPSAREGRL